MLRQRSFKATSICVYDPYAFNLGKKQRSKKWDEKEEVGKGVEDWRNRFSLHAQRRCFTHAHIELVSLTVTFGWYMWTRL